MQWLLGYFLCHSIDSSSPCKLSRVGHQLRRLPGCNFSDRDVVTRDDLPILCNLPTLQGLQEVRQEVLAWSGLAPSRGALLLEPEKCWGSCNVIASLRIFLRDTDIWKRQNILQIDHSATPPWIWYDVTSLNGNPPEHRRASSQVPSSDQPGCGKWKSWKVPQFERYQSYL